MLVRLLKFRPHRFFLKSRFLIVSSMFSILNPKHFPSGDTSGDTPHYFVAKFPCLCAHNPVANAFDNNGRCG
jgi:hypothetical protein